MEQPRRLLTRGRARASTSLGFQAFVPRAPLVRTPLVTIHGSSRSASRQFHALLPMAMALDVPLIAPIFPEGEFTGYQRLAGAAGPWSALDALERTLIELGELLDLDTHQVDLFGYSGGAQYAHRHALIAPQRLRRVVVASAGWFTRLDPGRPFPDGCGGLGSPGRTLDVEAFLRVPVHVLVGERDTVRDAALRTSASLDRRQGDNRLLRALSWIDHVEDVSARRGVTSQVTFDVLPDCRHSFKEAVVRGGLVERVFGFLHPEEARALDLGAGS